MFRHHRDCFFLILKLQFYFVQQVQVSGQDGLTNDVCGQTKFNNAKSDSNAIFEDFGKIFPFWRPSTPLAPCQATNFLSVFQWWSLQPSASFKWLIAVDTCSDCSLL